MENYQMSSPANSRLFRQNRHDAGVPEIEEAREADGEFEDDEAVAANESNELNETNESNESESEAEVEAAGQTNDAVKLYLRDIQKTKLLSADEERTLAIRVAQGDKAARDLMITSNLRLVVKLSKRYLNRGLPFLDLIEEGNLGLIKAVGRFDVSRGFRFSTYATWWIRQSVERALMNQAQTVRVPVHVAENISKLYRVTHRFREVMNREPTLAEVADSLQIDENQVSKLKMLTMRTYSLDQPMGEFSDYSLSDTLEDHSSVSPVDRIEGVDAFKLVSAMIETFSENEKKILALRFGLDNHDPQTLENIGRSFGLSRERIRQIESVSLQKLRVLLETRGSKMASC